MRTKSLSLYYKLTQKEVTPPPLKELERKDAWVKELQKTVESDWKPLVMKVTYELYNPEIEEMRRFFNGPCVAYYAIQNSDITSGQVSPETLKQYREEILDEMLGYDVKTVNKIIRKRKSTSDFKTVQAWHTFLKELEENLFDSAGYEFPDSKAFWGMVKAYGYEAACRISRETLQGKLLKK